MGWIWRGGESGEDLQAGHLFPWPLSIPRKYLPVLGTGIMGGGPCDPLVTGAKEKGKLPHLLCYRTEDKTGDWIIWNEEKGQGFQFLLSWPEWHVHSQGLPTGFVG